MSSYRELLEQAGYDTERMGRHNKITHALLRAGVIMAKRNGLSKEGIRQHYEEGKRLYRLKEQYIF